MGGNEDENVGIAFALTIGAGMATTVGSVLAVYVKLDNSRILAGSLAFAAGVMIVVSFCEILMIKCLDSFEAAGYDNLSLLYTYLTFFAGIGVCGLLEWVVHWMTSRHKGSGGHSHGHGHGGDKGPTMTPSTDIGDMVELLATFNEYQKEVGNAQPDTDERAVLTYLCKPKNEETFKKFLVDENATNVYEFYKKTHTFRKGVQSLLVKDGENPTKADQVSVEVDQPKVMTLQSCLDEASDLFNTYIAAEAPEQVECKEEIRHRCKTTLLAQYTYHNYPVPEGFAAHTTESQVSEGEVTIKIPKENPLPASATESRGSGAGAGLLVPADRRTTKTSTTPGTKSVVASNQNNFEGLKRLFNEASHSALQALANDLWPKYKETHSVMENSDELNEMGLITALAVAVHNFPEGLATFVAALDDPTVGLSIAVALALHNIPEGVCVAMPLYYSSGSKVKAFAFSFFSGMTEPLGAAIGYFILKGMFTDSVYAILFGLVAGMMIYISFVELLPTARAYKDAKDIIGPCLFAGMFLMAVSLVMFTV